MKEGRVAKLEDDPQRLREMKACLAEWVPTLHGEYFDNAFEIIDWLERHLSEVVLISLDHDLPLRGTHGEAIDRGDGRMVADFLARYAPTCPIIVHSANDHCAPGMLFPLEDAGWPTIRIVPHDEHAWVRSSWIKSIPKLVQEGWIQV